MEQLKAKASGMAQDLKVMPFMEHLKELRTRLIHSLIAVAVGFGVAYGFSEQIFRILLLPLLKVMPKDLKLVYTGLPEAFLVYMKVGLIGGLILAAPVVFYEIWKFIEPGLYQKERRYAIPFVLVASAFFAIGVTFAYFVVFPFGFQYFLSFSNDYIQPMISVKEFLGFSMKMLFAFGVVFELPVFAFFFSKVGLVTGQQLATFRRYAIVIIFIVAAILTPPDIFSQSLMAVPLLFLYEVSIVVAKVFGKKPEPE